MNKALNRLLIDRARACSLRMLLEQVAITKMAVGVTLGLRRPSHCLAGRQPALAVSAADRAKAMCGHRGCAQPITPGARAI